MSEKRVLPPDVYDALELSALAFGGIGHVFFGRDNDGLFAVGPNTLAFGRGCPVCVHGHAAFIEGTSHGTIRDALNHADIGYAENDEAVRESGSERIGFAEWCRRLNVVRGDEPTFDPANFPKKRRGAVPSGRGTRT